MHRLEQTGRLTRFSQASGLQTFMPHAAQAIVLPLRSAIGLRQCGRGFESRALAHAGPQALFLVTCSFVGQGKTAEQCWQIFQNGYTRLALPCGFFSKLENERSASFNKAAMLSGDDLIRAIRMNSEGGIVVLVDEQILDWLP